MLLIATPLARYQLLYRPIAQAEERFLPGVFSNYSIMSLIRGFVNLSIEARLLQLPFFVHIRGRLLHIYLCNNSVGKTGGKIP